MKHTHFVVIPATVMNPAIYQIAVSLALRIHWFLSFHYINYTLVVNKKCKYFRTSLKAGNEKWEQIRCRFTSQNIKW